MKDTVIKAVVIVVNSAISTAILGGLLIAIDSALVVGMGFSAVFLALLPAMLGMSVIRRLIAYFVGSGS